MPEPHARIITIGTSSGGIQALSQLLKELPSDFPIPLCIVLHIHPHSPSMLDRILGADTPLRVKFAEHEEKPQPGVAYLAPPDQHLLLKNGIMLLSHGPRENRFRPSIDPLFRSAAVSHNAGAIGVILTGLLDDGTAGMAAIKLCGGITVVQEPGDAMESEMPLSVLKQVEVDHCLPLAGMPALFQTLAQQLVREGAPVPEYLKKEVEISQGMGSWRMEDKMIGTPTAFTCPECGGTLTEIEEQQLVRYRCHEGHAYGPRTVIDAQAEKLEYSLWSAVRMLEEQSSMLRRMAERSQRQGSQESRYEERAREMHDHASSIKDFLLNEMQRKLEDS